MLLEEIRLLGNHSCLIKPLAILGLVALSAVSGAESSSALKMPNTPLQWFELQRAVGKGFVPGILRGGIAVAFNHPVEAERALKALAQASPHSSEANLARALLFDMYSRLGRYDQSLECLEQWLNAKREDRDLQALHRVYALAASYPNQSITSGHFSHLERVRSDNGYIVIPVSINNNSAHYVIDTGASVSILSESEAHRLRLSVHQIYARSITADDKEVESRVAVADHLTVGNFDLRNVLFFVFPDELIPSAAFQSGDRGVIGLPVLVALQRLRWNKDGAFEIGFQPEEGDSNDPNVCFDHRGAYVKVGFGRTNLGLQLDTGAKETIFSLALAKKFPNKVRGKTPCRNVGIGLGAPVECGALLNMNLRIDNFTIGLRRARVILSNDGERSDGSLGMDILDSAQTITLDFSSMRLMLK